MLDQSLTEFLEQGLAIHIGTRNAALRPNGCRVTAVRVEDQGRHLVAYLPKAATSDVLDDLRSNGQAAVSFARPTDDRAVQVKGQFISARDADPSEESFVLDQWRALIGQLDAIGLAPLTSTNTWLMWPCVAVTIRVTALFSQTPGPEAGSVLS
jgi:Pyridoxamine 5'-phosphate oxidase